MIASGAFSAFTPPEQVLNDEIGARTEWFDGRLRLNLTYFDMAYTDRQGAVQYRRPVLPTGFRIELANTGDVDLSGYEIEGQIAATDNFLIDFSAGLLDSTQGPVREQRRLFIAGRGRGQLLARRTMVADLSGSGLTFA